MTDEERYEYERGLDEYDDSPIGSCCNCGTNLYKDDASDLCGQCEWFAAQNMPEQRASE
jgi:hypothetical protein